MWMRELPAPRLNAASTRLRIACGLRLCHVQGGQMSASMEIVGALPSEGTIRSGYSRCGLALVFALVATGATQRSLSARAFADASPCCRTAPRLSTPRPRASRSAAPRASRAPRATHPRSTVSAPRTLSYAPRMHARSIPRAPRSAHAYSAEGRDRRGRLKRSAAAKDNFMRQAGHPHGWPGHVVDHIIPLACGGADAPSNMQWQTTAEAKAKDKTERIGCGASR